VPLLRSHRWSRGHGATTAEPAGHQSQRWDWIEPAAHTLPNGQMPLQLELLSRVAEPRKPPGQGSGMSLPVGQ